MSIEDLLSHPLLWRGQDGRSIDTPAIATGFNTLDRYLPGGGWPLTGISEIFIERYGLGELSLLMPALAALSNDAAAAKKWIVWIAPPFVPYAPALAHHGIDLSRILLVHPSEAHFSKRQVSGAKSDALWAVEQVIRSQSSVAVLAWVKEADVAALRRLQLGAEAYRCWTVLFRPASAMTESSPAALRLSLSPVSASGSASASASGSALTAPGSTRIDIHKCRGRRPRSLLL